MLISVYMPTKDRLPLLKLAISSVLTQTHQDVELLVVNDGSSDGTREYLDELVARDSRVRAIHHETPMGAPRSRNEAIRQARGTWITGLDDDDEFLPTRLEGLLNFSTFAERSGQRYSGVFSQDEVIASNGKTLSKKRGFVEYLDLFSKNHIGNQIFARREVFVGAGLFDESMPAWQDIDLMIRIVGKFGPALLLDMPLYRFNNDDRPDRISRKKKKNIVSAYERIVQKSPELPSRVRQNLYLQILAPFYGFPIEFSDLRRYFRDGCGPASIASWVGIVLTRYLTSLRSRRASA